MRSSSPFIVALIIGVVLVSCETAPRSPASSNKYCDQDAETIDFGSVLIGEMKIRTLTISANEVGDGDGGVSTTVQCLDQDLLISDYLGETETGEQEILLHEGEEVIIYLKFEPHSLGVKSATLTIGSDCKDVSLLGTGALEGGWTIDRMPGGHDLYDVWGSAYQVFACGASATVLNKVGSEGDWAALEETGIADVPLFSVWGFEGDAVWFGGGICDFGITYAKAYRYYPTLETWTELPAGLIDCFGSVWGTTACNIYFGGASIGGMMPNAVKWNCSENDGFIIGMEYDLVSGMFGSGPEDIWAVQANHYDSISHYNGTRWEGTKEPFMDKALFDVWVAPGGEACAVGAGGAIYYYNGVSWQDHTLESSADTIFGVWGLSADDIYAVGTNANIWHWDGNIWLSEAVPDEATGTLYSIWMGDSGVGYAVGKNGMILIYRADGS